VLIGFLGLNMANTVSPFSGSGPPTRADKFWSLRR
jgi:hypothetical protein